VLAFEDLQWADGGLMDFIEHVLQWSRDHPIFILALARPELAEKRPDWGAGSRNFTRLSLGPISADAMAKLLSGLVPGLPLLCDRMFPLFVTGRWQEALQSAAEIPEADLARGDLLGPVLALPAIHAAQGNLPGAQHVLSVCARFESSEDVQERAAYAVARGGAPG